MEFKKFKKSLNTNVVKITDRVGNVITIDPRNEGELVVESKCEYVKTTQDKEGNIQTLSFPFGPYFSKGLKPGIIQDRFIVNEIVIVKCPIERQGCIYKHMYKIKLNQCHKHVKWSL